MELSGARHVGACGMGWAGRMLEWGGLMARRSVAQKCVRTLTWRQRIGSVKTMCGKHQTSSDFWSLPWDALVAWRSIGSVDLSVCQEFRITAEGSNEDLEREEE